jgi:hypothetical protein
MLEQPDLVVLADVHLCMDHQLQRAPDGDRSRPPARSVIVAEELDPYAGRKILKA